MSRSERATVLAVVAFVAMAAVVLLCHEMSRPKG